MIYENVAIFNFSVEPTNLKSLIPKGLELDLYENKAIVTILSFTICQTKKRGNSECDKSNSIVFQLLTCVKTSEDKGFYCISSYSNSLTQVIKSYFLLQPKSSFRKISLKFDKNIFSLIKRPIFSQKTDTFFSWRNKEEASEKGLIMQFIINRPYLFIKNGKHIFKSRIHFDIAKCYEITHVDARVIQHSFIKHRDFQESVYINQMSLTFESFKPAMTPILFYDGKCGFCNTVLRMILNLDKKRIIKIAPNDGKTAWLLIDVKRAEDRIILLDDLGISEGALAFLRILDYLSWKRFFFYPLKLLPMSFLNFCYDKVAKHRLKCKIKIKPIEDERLLP